MSKDYVYVIRFILCSLAGAASFLFTTDVSAWTRARLTHVDVTLRVAGTGESEFTTDARFEVSGGEFHGFDLAPQAHNTLVPDKCSARIEGGLKTHVKIRKLFDGRHRVVLANRQYVKDGAVVFTLVHTTDLVHTGSLRRHNGRARLDWTPIIWDHGTDAMTVTVELPGAGSAIQFDSDTMRDYETITKSRSKIGFKKFRTVKWYPMQVVMDFDPKLVALPVVDLNDDNPETEALSNHPPAAATAAHAQEQARGGLHWKLIAGMVALFGLALMCWKTRWILRAHREVRVAPQFRFLPNTGFSHRMLLSAGAIVLFTAAQLLGSIAASVPAIAVAAMIWLMRRSHGIRKPRSGGEWRPMTDAEIDEMKLVLATYRRHRCSHLDGSCPTGIITFIISTGVLGIAVWKLAEISSTTALGTAIAGLIWLLPIWFSFTRKELPADPTIESFELLDKWKHGLSRLVKRMAPETPAVYWIRSDELGPIEVRLRITPPVDDVHSIEIASEVVQSRQLALVRKVAIFRLTPASETARNLAASPNAVEHHLTDDLKQEIVVIRNRRGKTDTGFAPLREAFSQIQNTH